jgi:hypothetical protein
MAAFSSHQRPLVVLLAAPFSDQDIKEEVFFTDWTQWHPPSVRDVSIFCASSTGAPLVTRSAAIRLFFFKKSAKNRNIHLGALRNARFTHLHGRQVNFDF